MNITSYIINRSDLEEAKQLQPMDESSTATKTGPVIANHVHISGKC